MIDVIFYFGAEVILVRVHNGNLLFKSSTFGNVWGTIDGLKLSKAGVEKEFPDLVNDDQWNTKAIERFKAKIGTMKDEKEIANYLIQDLKSHGYIPKFYQEAGFRKISL